MSVYGSERVYYSPNVLRQIIISFADMFNKIKVRRYADDWFTIVKEIPVGLNTLVPTKMYLERIEDYTSEGGSSRFYKTTPFMNLNLTGLSIDKSRNMSSNSLRVLYEKKEDISSINDILTDMQPVPYTFDFKLTIKTGLYSDFIQIIEQILPFYNDDAYLRVQEIPFLNIERDLKVTILNVSPEVPTEMGEEDSREVNCEIDFSVEGWMYRPIRDIALIKRIKMLIDQNGVEKEHNDVGYHLGSFDTEGNFIVGGWYEIPYGDLVPADAVCIEFGQNQLLQDVITYKVPEKPIPSNAEFIEVVDCKFIRFVVNTPIADYNSN